MHSRSDRGRHSGWPLFFSLLLFAAPLPAMGESTATSSDSVTSTFEAGSTPAFYESPFTLPETLAAATIVFSAAEMALFGLSRAGSPLFGMLAAMPISDDAGRMVMGTLLLVPPLGAFVAAQSAGAVEADRARGSGRPTSTLWFEAGNLACWLGMGGSLLGAFGTAMMESPYAEAQQSLDSRSQVLSTWLLAYVGFSLASELLCLFEIEELRQ